MDLLIHCISDFSEPIMTNIELIVSKKNGEIRANKQIIIYILSGKVNQGSILIFVKQKMRLPPKKNNIVNIIQRRGFTLIL